MSLVTAFLTDREANDNGAWWQLLTSLSRQLCKGGVDQRVFHQDYCSPGLCGDMYGFQGTMAEPFLYI